MDKKLVQAFALDLGIVLGAKSEQEALLAGAQAIQKLGEQTTTLMMQVWYLAELQLKGKGKEAIAQVLQQMQQPRSAKFGAKLIRILELNGHCPEGYVVEKYQAGGCVKCAKKKLLTQTMLCGGKKRIRKSQEGTKTKETKNGVTKTTHEGPDDYSSKVKTTRYTDNRTGEGHYATQEAGRQDSTFTNRAKYYELERKFNKKNVQTKAIGGTIGLVLNKYI